MVSGDYYIVRTVSWFETFYCTMVDGLDIEPLLIYRIIIGPEDCCYLSLASYLQVERRDSANSPHSNQQRVGY
jgi:hypothetical protein